MRRPAAGWHASCGARARARTRWNERRARSTATTSAQPELIGESMWTGSAEDVNEGYQNATLTGGDAPSTPSTPDMLAPGNLNQLIRRVRRIIVLF